MKRLLFCYSPPQQGAEWLSYLINHSPDIATIMRADVQWEQTRTEYGTAEDPMESHWCVPSTLSLDYKTFRNAGPHVLEWDVNYHIEFINDYTAWLDKRQSTTANLYVQGPDNDRWFEEWLPLLERERPDWDITTYTVHADFSNIVDKENYFVVREFESQRGVLRDEIRAAIRGRENKSSNRIQGGAYNAVINFSDLWDTGGIENAYHALKLTPPEHAWIQSALDDYLMRNFGLSHADASSEALALMGVPPPPAD